MSGLLKVDLDNRTFKTLLLDTLRNINISKEC